MAFKSNENKKAAPYSSHFQNWEVTTACIWVSYPRIYVYIYIYIYIPIILYVCVCVCVFFIILYRINYFLRFWLWESALYSFTFQINYQILCILNINYSSRPHPRMEREHKCVCKEAWNRQIDKYLCIPVWNTDRMYLSSCMSVSGQK